MCVAEPESRILASLRTSAASSRRRATMDPGFDWLQTSDRLLGDERLVSFGSAAILPFVQ